MTYTRPWLDTSPPDTDLAKNIAADMRNIRQDVHDRANSLVVDWTTDPVVPLPSILGNVTGKFGYVAGVHMNWSTQLNYYAGQQPAYYSPSQGIVVTSPAGPPLAAPPQVFGQIVLPNGVTVTQFGVTAGPIMSATTVNCSFYIFNTSLLTSTPIATCTITGANQFAKSGVFSVPVSTNLVCFVQMSSPNAGLNVTYSIQYAFCLYNTPDCRSTL